MKIIGTILMVLGLAIMALNIFSPEKLETRNAVALVLGGMSIILGLFVRSRTKTRHPHD